MMGHNIHFNRVVGKISPFTPSYLELCHGVVDLNPAGGEILSEPRWCFIALTSSLSSSHCLDIEKEERAFVKNVK